MSVPSEDFVKEHYTDLVADFIISVQMGGKGEEEVKSGSNFEILANMWADEGQVSKDLGFSSPLKIFAEILGQEGQGEIKCDLHPSTGERKVIFDDDRGHYFTVVKEDDKLLFSGIGSAFGQYVTKKYEDQFNYKEVIENFVKDVVNGGTGQDFVQAGSNMELLMNGWQGEIEASQESGTSSPLVLLATTFQSLVLDGLDMVSVSLHPTGDKKIIFDQTNGYYFTITQDEDGALLTGIGSALGRYITQIYEAQYE